MCYVTDYSKLHCTAGYKVQDEQSNQLSHISSSNSLKIVELNKHIDFSKTKYYDSFYSNNQKINKAFHF